MKSDDADLTDRWNTAFNRQSMSYSVCVLGEIKNGKSEVLLETRHYWEKLNHNAKDNRESGVLDASCS